MQLISTKICKTGDIGINDNLFGGIMLAWMDEAGGNLAALLCSTPNMITLKINEVLFKRPVKVKEHVRIYGKPLEVGKSSLRIYVEARVIDFVNNTEAVVCSTEMLFVRIDEKGNAIPIGDKARNSITQLITDHP
ncbi:MAG: acyl-CoA thioesterase [Bacteroidales bacterium]|nr:acyl-CoA thioesterase [Bacteroidales bacterium]